VILAAQEQAAGPVALVVEEPLDQELGAQHQPQGLEVPELGALLDLEHLDRLDLQHQQLALEAAR
jgi:hypothetical protein